MKKPHGLRTLGDYRRAAHDPRFAFSLYPEGKNGSPYEALKIALSCVRNHIGISRANLSEENWWRSTCFLGTEYEMSNPQLFDCVKLMEFANTYKGFQSFERLFIGWPKRPDVNARMLDHAGLSYLEAAFGFVRESGGDIILRLQNAYKKYRKEGNIIYRDPIKFLSETPTVDDLEIRPVPDIIIRTWFADIVKGTQKWIQENNISRFNVDAEFNSIKKQLAYEMGLWEMAPDKDGQGDNWHNEDFTEVRWNGKKYTFNKTQARVVEYLWANKRASEKSIGEHIETANDHYRLRHTFRQKNGKKVTMHLAWGTMIVKNGKGIYALSEKKQKSPKK